jgi:hypothetical protein
MRRFSKETYTNPNMVCHNNHKTKRSFRRIVIQLPILNEHISSKIFHLTNEATNLLRNQEQF